MANSRVGASTTAVVVVIRPEPDEAACWNKGATSKDCEDQRRGDMERKGDVWGE